MIDIILGNRPNWKEIVVNSIIRMSLLNENDGMRETDLEETILNIGQNVDLFVMNGLPGIKAPQVLHVCQPIAIMEK